MTIIEKILRHTSALRVREAAEMLGVTPQHIYSLASRGRIPSLRIEGAIRLDPQEFAAWLRDNAAKHGKPGRSRAA